MSQIQHVPPKVIEGYFLTVFDFYLIIRPEPKKYYDFLIKYKYTILWKQYLDYVGWQSEYLGWSPRVLHTYFRVTRR